MSVYKHATVAQKISGNFSKDSFLTSDSIVHNSTTVKGERKMELEI